ncbi:teichoic acid export protein ATP-binding subunit [Bacillus toyonensis]|uniref:Teichoic acids export ABC transporter ATP-binding subunit TagH n=1 Tax=Bacillus toyonensis TaxID=155322 RepID=A0ABX6GFW2_9BACI|nr:teichoic acids export ABC transporter ATP-binding subunit TagH [Bacillus toyonensis]KNH40875.1 teichoic acids export protein ATP-binding subunit [Bacillus thuringiensis]MED2710494.1 teichoic acids export ABC transporter ATP-binding subunit TagH [Bacillus toyonensis]MED2738155.1 teichoic acids export ABC transporter ATP-binding subunit TagH [Bacillus toyonensis]PDY89753.1 teichoic acid export protein ATP-binding subunit [Bacillus toyonensis]PDZ29407.1 teichoic acid export protein ATP-binding
MNYKVKFEHVTKRYKMYNKPSDKLKDLFFKSDDGEYHYALNNISFEVPEGEIVGIVGLNGSGKSTLSNLIAGVTIPYKGKVDIKGSAALIAISSGLNGQLTGIENIELKGLMMGLTKEQIKEITPKVIEFADIGKFIYQPVKTYSSGMKSRIGFAISVHINPDILVIDEALSVGDQTFTKKCLDKMNEFKEQGKTIFFISHSLAQVKSFCTKALWLHYGRFKEYGEVHEVVGNYEGFLKKYNQMTAEEREKQKEEEASNLQHGLLQRNSASLKRKPCRKVKRKQFVISAIALTLIVAGITAGIYYKDTILGTNKADTNAGKIVSSKTVAENKISEKEKVQKYVVKSNGISIRKEAKINSDKIGIANFGEIFSVVNKNKNIEKNEEWSEVQLLNGENGWINTNYMEPFNSGNAIVEDTKLVDLTKLLKRVYGANIVNAPGYLGKTIEELKSEYPTSLISLPEQAGKKIVKDGNIQFAILQDKVIEVVFQDISMSFAKLHEVLGTEMMNNDNEKHYFYETKSYYIAARSDETHKEIQSISIVKK